MPRNVYNPLFQLCEADKKQWHEFKVREKDYYQIGARLFSEPRRPVVTLSEYQSLYDLFEDDKYADGEEYVNAVSEVVEDLLVGGNVAHLREFFNHPLWGDDRSNAVTDIAMFLELSGWISRPFRPEMLSELFRIVYEDNEFKDWAGDVCAVVLECASQEEAKAEQIEFLVHTLVFLYNQYAHDHRMPLRKETEVWNSMFGQDSTPDINHVRADDYAAWCCAQVCRPVLFEWLYEKAGRPQVYPREMAQLLKLELIWTYDLVPEDLAFENGVAKDKELNQVLKIPPTCPLVRVFGMDRIRDIIERYSVYSEEPEKEEEERVVEDLVSGSEDD